MIEPNVEVEAFLTEAALGIWCDACATGSGVRVPFALFVDGVLHGMHHWALCLGEFHDGPRHVGVER